MEEVAPHSLDVCVCMCVRSSYFHSESLKHPDCEATRRRRRPRVGRAHGRTEDQTLSPLPLSLPPSFKSSLSVQAEAVQPPALHRQQYALRLQAAMGRAVMVGRGPTGAGVLLLFILQALTAEAQKGG